MNAHLHYLLAQQRTADLQRAAERARLATDAGADRRDSRDSSPIVRALPMPTAHPSPEAWPDAKRAAREMLLAVAPDQTLKREGTSSDVCTGDSSRRRRPRPSFMAIFSLGFVSRRRSAGWWCLAASLVAYDTGEAPVPSRGVLL